MRYLNLEDRNPAGMKKPDKDFDKKLDFKDIKFPVKVRDVHKIEKQNSIGITVFGYENKEKHAIYVFKKICKEKHVDLLLIEESCKRHYVLIKTFNKFMYNHFLYH